MEKCFASFSVYKQLWLFHGSKIRNLLPNKLGHGGFVNSLQNFKFENSKLVGKGIINISSKYVLHKGFGKRKLRREKICIFVTLYIWVPSKKFSNKVPAE